MGSESLKRGQPSADAEGVWVDQFPPGFGPWGTTGSDDGQTTVIVTVPVVRMMEMALDQVVDVVAVGHALMTAVGAVDVIGRVSAARMVGGASAAGCRRRRPRRAHPRGRRVDGGRWPSWM